MNIHRPHELTLRQRWTLFAVFGLFFLLFASISLVNHYVFRTFGWDLGYFNMAIFDYSQARLNEYDLYNTGLRFTLGDHFEPIMFLIAPLRYLFGQYTLLLVQIGAVLFGGYGAFVYIRHRSDSAWLPHLAMVHFLAIWGISAALSFDYHNNVVGAMFLPWFLHYFGKERFRAAFICLLLLCMSKENMALWAVFIAMGAGIGSFRHRKKVFAAVGFTVFAGLYFVWAMKVVLPYYQPEGFEYVHFRYELLGENMGEALETILTRPGYVFTLLYENHYPDSPGLDDVKPELYRMMLLSGGLALILRPQYLLMALPIIGQKVFSDKPGTWGINNHYSIELVPVLSIAVCSVLLSIRQKPFRMALAVLVAGMTLFVTLYSFSYRDPAYHRIENQDIFDASHWQTQGFEMANMQEALALIPPEVSVCASNSIVPHLAMRDCVHMYPFIGSAQYVILLQGIHVFPERPETHAEVLKNLRGSPEWTVIFQKGNFLVFKKEAVEE